MELCPKLKKLNSSYVFYSEFGIKCRINGALNWVIIIGKFDLDYWYYKLGLHATLPKTVKTLPLSEKTRFILSNSEFGPECRINGALR